MAYMNDTTRWHLLRHAPAAVKEGFIYGRTDVSIATPDPAQIAGLVNSLPDGVLLITTGLKRTEETAALLEEAGLAVADRLTEADFAEQDFGKWEEDTHASLGANNSAEYRNFWTNPARNRPPGGESFADVMTRCSLRLRRLTATHQGRDILLVGHGGSIRALLAIMLGIAPENALGLDIDPLSLSLADHHGGENGQGGENGKNKPRPGPLSPWRVRGTNLLPGR